MTTPRYKILPLPGKSGEKIMIDESKYLFKGQIGGKEDFYKWNEGEQRYELVIFQTGTSLPGIPQKTLSEMMQMCGVERYEVREVMNDLLIIDNEKGTIAQMFSMEEAKMVCDLLNRKAENACKECKGLGVIHTQHFDEGPADNECTSCKGSVFGKVTEVDVEKMAEEYASAKIQEIYGDKSKGEEYAWMAEGFIAGSKVNGGSINATLDLFKDGSGTVKEGKE